MRNLVNPIYNYNQAALGRLAICLLGHEPQTNAADARSILITRLGVYKPQGIMLDRVVGDYFGSKNI